MKRRFDSSYCHRKQSFTKFEDLPNEVLYELFEYLDVYYLFPAFSNLNQRFQSLLYHSSLPLQIDSSISNALFHHSYTKLVVPHIERLIYLRLSGKRLAGASFQQFFLNSSFAGLQSLVLNDIEYDNFQFILQKLAVILHLCTLKVALISDSLANRHVPTPINNSLSDHNYSSTIKNLNLSFSCTSPVLAHILSYTPQIRRLNCQTVHGDEIQIRNMLPIKLLHLTYFSIDNCNVSFTNLQILIEHLVCSLKIFSIGVCYDQTYCDPNRWEKLIVKHWPQLRHLEFHCKRTHADGNVHSPDENLFDRFQSSFWIERQWIPEQHITKYDQKSYSIYSISPYKNKWYYLNNSIQSISQNEIELTLEGGFFSQVYLTSIINGHSSITVLHLITFYADFYTNVDKLIEILQFLPNLRALQTTSYSLIPLPEILHQRISLLHSLAHQNRINQVSIKRIQYPEEVLFFIHLCSHLQHLEIHCSNQINLESFIISTLAFKDIQSHHHFRSLCVHSKLANDRIVQFLQREMNGKKLLSNCTIERISTRIQLTWK